MRVSSFWIGANCLVLITLCALSAASRSTNLLAKAEKIDASSPWPFDPAPLNVLRQSPKLVFAVYMPQFPISVDNQPPDVDRYALDFLSPDGENGKFKAVGGMTRERPLPQAPLPYADWQIRNFKAEVHLAEAAGIDGFILCVFTDKGPRWQRMLDLMTAAHEADPNFKIIPMMDMSSMREVATYSGEGTSPEDVPKIIETLAHYPAAMRLPDGRLVVNAFMAEAKSADWWQDVFAQINQGGIKVAFVPTFLNWNASASFVPISYGFASWGNRDARPNSKMIDTEGPEARKEVSIWMPPVGPQDERPKSQLFWEAEGSLNYRSMWMSVITHPSDWAQVVTWNDFTENSEVRPSTSIGDSFYDLTAYYANWFKTGKQPQIKRDVLYYFHRLQTSTATANFPDPREQPWTDRGVTPTVDNIEVLAFLKAPGHIAIKIAGHEYGEDAPAGITSFTCPLAPGVPEFILTRNGQPVIDVKSRHSITDSVEHWNMEYAGGSSARGGM